MAEDLATHCLVMLNQAHGLGRHNPHDAIARIDALLHEIETARDVDPSVAPQLEAVRKQAQAARIRYVAELDRWREQCETRNRAYTARIRSEIGI